MTRTAAKPSMMKISRFSDGSLKAVMFVIAFLAVSNTMSGQADSSWDARISHQLLDSMILKKTPRNPKKATIMSAILPGAGQLYNRQYYKVSLVYAALGGMIYTIDFNTRNFKIYDEAYKARLADEDTPDFPPQIPDQAILNARNEFRKNKELSYFGLGLVYLLNIADAFVSAHLSTFNVEDDLISGRIKLIDAMDLTGQPFPCLGLTMNF